MHVPLSIELPQLCLSSYLSKPFMLRVAILIAIVIRAPDNSLVDDEIIEPPVRSAAGRCERYC